MTPIPIIFERRCLPLVTDRCPVCTGLLEMKVSLILKKSRKESSAKGFKERIKSELSWVHFLTHHQISPFSLETGDFCEFNTKRTENCLKITKGTVRARHCLKIMQGEDWALLKDHGGGAVRSGHCIKIMQGDSEKRSLLKEHAGVVRTGQRLTIVQGNSLKSGQFLQSECLTGKWRSKLNRNIQTTCFLDEKMLCHEKHGSDAQAVEKQGVETHLRSKAGGRVCRSSVAFHHEPVFQTFKLAYSLSHFHQQFVNPFDIKPDL